MKMFWQSTNLTTYPLMYHFEEQASHGTYQAKVYLWAPNALNRQVHKLYIWFTTFFFYILLLLICHFTYVNFSFQLLPRRTIKSFIQGFLPGIALKIFLILLPSILMFMSKVEGLTSVSSLERRSAFKYYIFLFFNVFLGSIIAGSALEQLKTFLHQSANEYVLLSTPQAAPSIHYPVCLQFIYVLIPQFNLILQAILSLWLSSTKP